MGINGSSGDFEALAKQYWDTWNELLGRGGGGLDAFGLAGAMPPGIGRMDPAAFDWYAKMQQLAAQFGGQQPSASDITSAWRSLLGGPAADPFGGLLRGLQGGSMFGNGWVDQARPWLDGLMQQWRHDNSHWLHRPAFGPQREHQERLQRLALAWQEWQDRNQAFVDLLSNAGSQAFALFEQRLEQRDVPGERIESARALFDLWIDAAEDAWAEIALTPDFRHAYAEMTNAQMRLRLGVQREVEQVASLFGMPTRTEVDSVHRKVADLERALHAARRGAQPSAAARAPAQEQNQATAERAPSGPRPQRSARKPAAASAPKASQPRRTASKAKAGTSSVASPVGADAAPAPAPKGKSRRTPAAAPAAQAAKTAARKASPAASAKKAKKPTATSPARATRAAAAAKKAPSAATIAAPVVPAAKAAPSKVRKAATKKRAKATAAQPNVVSMKDWVNRNLDAGADAAAPRGKRGGPRK